MAKAFRRRLIAGLIVITPLGVTLYILWWLFRTVDGLLGRYVYGALGVMIPGLGLLMLIALLLGVGWLAERTIGTQIFNWWNGVLERVPIVSRLYGATRRIVGSVFGGEEKKFFREVVLFEYPSPGQWTLGFVTGRAPAALAERVQDGVTIFLPTAPNPVTGFLIIVPRARTIRLPVTVEDGFTFILSAGAVPPGGAAPGLSAAAVRSATATAATAAAATPPPPTSRGHEDA
ncbi:MAG TPA: DUF502 domain-containing protein [Longimicrobiales bacterium]|nr:DUF502 domain-containing protein [Longimicrobiales bacterium]